MADSATQKAKQRERNVSGTGSIKSSKEKPRPSALEMTDGALGTKPLVSKQKKLGHRGVDPDGNTVYKKTTTTTLMNAIQLGIQHSVGGLSAKPERDVLLQDFAVVESVFFPREGSNITQAHQYPDFRFKTYAPVAFRYFRDLFGIQPDDHLISLVNRPLRELSNPGASGSVFYLSEDDEFIIKTVQHKEADFLQKLLPGYYMNLNQNPRTLLPKFYGLYTYQSGGRNIRLIVMNNLLPSHLKMHLKFDLKGSTFKRKSSKYERKKTSPTLKDLDFKEVIPEGILLDAPTYSALSKTLLRDVRVLESFKIMDYSLLVAIHNLDQAEKEARELLTPTGNGGDNTTPLPDTPKSWEVHSNPETPRDLNITGADALVSSTGIPHKLERSFSRSRRVAKHNTTREAIQGQSESYVPDPEEESCGGIPAKNSRGERILLFLGIIDILQCYQLKKKMEHRYKALIHDGETVSVCRPDFYAKRFQDFIVHKVFKKIPPPKHSPSKRKGQSGFYSSSGRERKRTGDSSKDAQSLERGLMPPTATGQSILQSGPKSKTSRPDLVPSTPPKPERELVSKKDENVPQESVSSHVPESVSVSRLAEPTGDQTQQPDNMEDIVKVQTDVINETLDLSQPGSSTIDDTASDSSPRKSGCLSVDSLGEEYITDMDKTPVADAEYEDGMGCFLYRRVHGLSDDENNLGDVNPGVELKSSEHDDKDDSVEEEGNEGSSWL